MPLYPEIICHADELVYGLNSNQNLSKAWLQSTTFIYKFHAHRGLERPRIKFTLKTLVTPVQRLKEL